MRGRRSLPSFAFALALFAAGPQPAWAEPAEGAEGEPDRQTRRPTLTRAPRLVTPPAPVYPPDALAEGRAADVGLELDLDETGAVTAVVITKPAGEGFDEAAADAAARLRFEPAEIDDRPSAIRITFTMRFRPDVRAPAAEPEPEPPNVPAPALEPPEVVVATGRVREKGTRDPIVGADVALVALADGTARPASSSRVVATTDAEGSFVARGPPGVRLRLVISDGTHEPCVRDVFLAAEGGIPTDVLCSLEARMPVLETRVEAPRAAPEVTRHTLAREELRTVPGTFGDPLRAIQTLPGIARVPFGLGLLVIRGSSPQDTGVYVDGVKVPLLYHFLGGPSVLTPDLIDRIDFYPGGFGVRYGRATAGVLDVTTRTDDTRRLHGSGKVDLIDSAVYVEGPLGKHAAGGVAGRRSYIDAILPLALSSGTTVAPVYYDYQARATISLGKKGTVQLFAFGSHDALEVVTNNPDLGGINLGSSVGFHRLVVPWTTTFGAWKSRLAPSYGYDQVGFDTGQLRGNGGAHVLSLREDLQREITRGLRVGVGFDGETRFDNLDFRVPIPPLRRTYGRTQRPIEEVARSLANSAAAVYAEALWDVTPRLRIIPGLRLDWYHWSKTERLSFDPRVVVRWQRSPTQALKVGAGLFHQSPETWQLDPLTGNPRLELIWADQYHLGLEQQITKQIGLDATLYYLRRHDLPIASTNLDPATGRPENLASEGRGRGYGLELRLRHALTPTFYGWISYTLSRAEIVNLVARPGEPPPEYRPTPFDQTHNLIVVASRTFRAWELGTRFRLVTGIPETPVVGSTYDADLDDYDPVRATPYSRRRPTFHQLDVRLERTWTYETWRLGAYLDVQNIYNAANPEATLYDYRFRQSGPLRGLPILPTIGVRGRF